MIKEENTGRDILNKEYLKENSFRVPEGYFEDFDKALLNKLNESNVEPVMPAVEDNRPAWVHLLKPAVGLVASFSTIFFLGWGIMKLTTSPYQINNLTEMAKTGSGKHVISEEDLLKSTLADYNFEAAYEIITSDDTSKIDPEAIEEYLINSNISQLGLASLE